MSKFVDENIKSGLNLPRCNYCKHRNEDNPLVCPAFPNGIPDEILFNELMHTKPVKGQQNNIKFERDEEDR